LGLNGLYKLNIITLFLFWVSLLLYIKYIFIDQKVYILNIGSWVFLNLNIRIDYYFLIDTISFSFILLTTSIALFVFIYAFAYFKYEPLVDRFLLFILSFVISMIFLVSSGNTIMLFLG
jgi:NADH:ubiquinone oxidoreductase subunit 5 (subunit L)/multisubunit Na+/H+ antiporter MnhA subunit